MSAPRRTGGACYIAVMSVNTTLLLGVLPQQRVR
jgi:hypothetical protein